MITGPIVETSLARLPGYTRPEANDRLADVETAEVLPKRAMPRPPWKRCSFGPNAMASSASPIAALSIDVTPPCEPHAANAPGRPHVSVAKRLPPPLAAGAS